jgi:hypothetical protein
MTLFRIEVSDKALPGFIKMIASFEEGDLRIADEHKSVEELSAEIEITLQNIAEGKERTFGEEEVRRLTDSVIR